MDFTDEKFFKELEELEKRCGSHPFEVYPRLEGWSDEVAIKVAQKTELPMDHHNDRAIVQRCARFLKFYCTGEIMNGDSTLTTIADMAFTAHNSKGYVFKPGKPSESPNFFQGTSSNKVEKLLSAYCANRSTIDKLEITGAAKTVWPTDMPKETQDNLSKTILKYDEKRLKNFMEHIANHLNPMLDGELNLVELKRIVSVLSYLALVLFRAVIKDSKQLGNSFNKKSFSQTLYAVTNWPLSYPFSPPCDLAITRACCALTKSTIRGGELFTKIVVQWLEFEKDPNSEHAVFLSSAVLDDTKFNGIGLIEMVLKCEKILHVDWRTVLELSLLRGTEESWERIIKFFTEHVEETKNPTCYWARLIDDCYFRDLSQKENPRLAGILAGIIMEKEGDGMLKAAWAKKNLIILNISFAKGREIYQKFTSIKTSTESGRRQ